MNFHNWLHFQRVSPFFLENMKIMFSIYFVLLYFKKPAKLNFIQGHIATTLVSVNEAEDDARDKPAKAMEDDLSDNENDSNFGDDGSSTEDDVIRATVNNDGDSERGDDDSSGESETSDNDLAPESIFIKTKSDRVTTNYNRVRLI